MNDSELLRYSRHILLPEIGIEGQERIGASSVLVVGAGGLGSPVSIYLAASGVGRITICDHDSVELSNLQRQIVHKTGALKMPKALSAKNTLAEINPEIEVVAVEARATGELLKNLVREATLVVDASDNFSTRNEVNRVCHQFSKPLVSGAALGFQGQVSVFDFRRGGPCYGCLFPESGAEEAASCAASGVFSPLVGIIGAVQAAEALKLLIPAGESLSGRLLLLDALAMNWREIRFSKDPACPVCG